MIRTRTILAMLGTIVGLALAPVQAHAATNFFCDEYSGDEFLVSSHYSHRLNSQQVVLEIQSDLPVHVHIYASGAGDVYDFDMGAWPVGNDGSGHGGNTHVAAYIVSSQGHWWSAGSYAFDTNVPNSWYSSLHYGNHCGSNSVWIPGA